ncbi:mirror-image polydactyly gene 1 protein isoform X1 [Arapaima gigas]
MDVRNKVCAVHSALQRAKWKISNLEKELSEKENCSENEENLQLIAPQHKTELQESLVDMYKANPKVNEELKQRLPSSLRLHCSETIPALRLPTLNGSCDTQTVSGTGLEESQKESRAFQPPSTTKEQVERPPPDQDFGALASDRMVEEELCHSPGFLTQGALTLGRRGEEPVIGHAYNLHLALDDGGSRSAASSVQVDHGNTKASSEFNSAKQLPVLDKERNIAFLLKELDSLRDLNKKLQDQLATKEKELEMRLVDAELKETELEAKACQKAGALVEEIYTAQRDRDRALMARLRLANEERDEALLRARRLQQAAAEYVLHLVYVSDQDLEELLNRVNSADSAQGIERSGLVIVDLLQKFQERRRKITAEEMNAVIEERDGALSRCKRLEQDLHQVREQSWASANNSRHLTAENNQERAWKDELEAVRKERDWAVEQSQKMEKEIQALHFYISQHHSLSQEPGMTEQFKSILNSFPEALCSGEAQASEAHLHSQQLLGHVQLLASEYRSTQAQLQHAQEAEREAKEKVQKLERLVEVLRKKVGTGGVRTVI